MKNITIKEVAELAGVSISSVSRYLKDPNSIKPIAAVKVAQAIRELDFVPSNFAQNLRRGHSNTIGVIVPQLTQYFADACTGISRFLSQYGYLMIICDTEYNPDRERYYIKQLIQQGVAGIILASAEQDEGAIIKSLGGFKNLVYFVRPVPSNKFSSVNEDIIDGAKKITRAILERGNRDFLLLSNSLHFKNHRRKADMVIKTLMDSGIEESSISHVPDIVKDGKVVDVIEQYIDKPGDGKCILCLGPYISEKATIALGILNANDSVNMAGFTSKDYSDRFRRSIVSSIQEPFEIGLKAGEVVLKMVEGSKEEKEILLPMEYMIYNKLILPKR